MPQEYDKKLLDFQRYVVALRKKKDYLLSQISNADQTPVWFDMPDSIVSLVGERSVPVKTCADKQCCAVMLAITADGPKLPLYESFPPGIVVRAQEKVWMTDELALDWLNDVWKHLPGGRAMLVLDSFRGYLTEKLRSVNEDSDLVVIPGVMTKLQQPLDVVLNHPFKAAFRWQYNS
ncbi:hypothetical protein PR048_030030 [Dryococelus australis]|uniref:DDE-1 domain-containing protein n=1 Tax=Dryococelus australis TaxID=614101 RepID=A0ABQ9G8L5_9NEOP|nr:hypothetical protein PR048_030030 [Dryococelus australis]